MVATEVEQQFPERVRKQILAGPLPMTDVERQRFLDGVQKSEIEFVYQADGSHLVAACIYDHNRSILKIKRLTLILTNNGGRIYENAKVVRTMRPGFQFFELQGGGIDIVDQQPDAWSEAVARFLKA
jgi:hypothetical protein